MQESKKKELLTVEEMALVLKVPPFWIYQRTRGATGKIPHYKLGRHVRFDQEEVLKYFAKNGGLEE